MRGLSAVVSLVLILAVSLSAIGQDCDSIPVHFLFTDSTGISYPAVIDSTTAPCSLEACDEIGVFDGDLCVGAAVYEGSWPLTISAWADDPATPEVDGYTVGDTMSFRVWHAEAMTEQQTVSTYSDGDGTFGAGPLAQLYISCCTYPDSPGAPAVSDDNPCSGAQFTVSWESVTGAIEYRLTENGELIYQGPETMITRDNIAGLYSYRVQACGPCQCSAESPATSVEIDSLPPAPSGLDIAPDPVCVDGLYCLTWYAVSGATRYEYRQGEGPWMDVGNATQRCFSPGAAGQYSYQVRACDECGCGPASASDSVTVKTVPPALDTIILSPDTACVSVQFCLSWDTIAGAVRYDIRRGGGVWMDVGNSTVACFTESTPGEYTYSVRACNECGCTNPAASRTVSVRAIPAVPAEPVVSINPACIDEEYCLSWTPVAGADRYELRENGGSWQDLGDTTSWCTSQPAMGLFAYELRACNGCGCSSPASAATVSVQSTPSPPAPVNISAGEVCLDEEYCLNWSPVATATMYQYSENGSGWIDIGDTTSLCLSHDTAGFYTYRIRAGNGCGFGTASASVAVTVEEAVESPDQPLVDINPACVNHGYYIEWAQVGGATRYEVRADSGLWVSVGTLTYAFYASSIPGEHVYEVRACDHCGCSPPSDPVTVAVESVPSAPAQIQADDSMVCAEQLFCLTWDSVEGADRYEIRDQGGLWFDVGDTTTACITEESVGGYNYEVRACNHCGCSDPSPTVSVLVSPPPSQPAPPTAQPNPVCAGQEVCLEWSALPGVDNYQLRRDSGLWNDLGDTNRTCLALDTFGDYLFELRACDECGCSLPSDPLLVTVPAAIAAPEQVSISDDTLCVGAEYCLNWASVEGAESYEIRVNAEAWTSAGLDTSICYTPTAAGDYHYQVRACGPCGCGAPGPEAAVSILDRPGQPSQPTADTDTACVGGDVCLTWTPTTGAAYYQLREVGGMWLDVADSLRYCFSRSSPGDYRFVIRACNDCGCSDESPVRIVTFEPRPGIPGAPIIVSSPICTGSELCMQWAPVGGATSYEWQQDNGPWIDVGAETMHCLPSAPMGEHQYRVRACAGCGCGDPGPAKTVDIGTTPGALDSVIVSTDPVCQDGEFCLTWPALINAKVYHVSVDNGPWTSVGSSRSYCDTLIDSENHSFYVRGCNDCGCGNPAPEVILSPQPLPGRPSLTNCGFDGSQLRMSWTTATNAVDYRIYRDGSQWMATSGTTLVVTPDYGGEHSFYIRAANDCGPGESSDTCLVTLPTGVDDPHDHKALPGEFSLGQNYPNPFNPETRIDFALPRGGTVRIEVVNMLGRTVRVVVDRPMPAGYHSVVWDGTDQRGRVVSSGVYFYRMQAGAFRASRKMLLMR